jgi:putative alpha-1,2-mannosidase
VNYDKNYLEHADMLKGGTLLFNMSEKPNLQRGISKASFPYSFSD